MLGSQKTGERRNEHNLGKERDREKNNVQRAYEYSD